MREEIREMFNKINIINENVLIEENTVMGTKENVIKYLDNEIQELKELIISNEHEEYLESNINVLEEMIELLCELKFKDNHKSNDIIMLLDSLMGNYKYIATDIVVYDELFYYFKIK